MRYLFVHLDPVTGREQFDTAWHRDYKNVNNAIRFGLARDKMPAGQYRIYSHPRGGQISEVCVTAYRLV